VLLNVCPLQMPPGAEEARANQKAALAGVVHEAKVDPKIGELVAALEDASELGVAERANIREAKKMYERNTRLSTELASRMAQVGARAR
jgi:carboxypeptidase Taq